MSARKSIVTHRRLHAEPLARSLEWFIGSNLTYDIVTMLYEKRALLPPISHNIIIYAIIADNIPLAEYCIKRLAILDNTNYWDLLHTAATRDVPADSYYILETVARLRGCTAIQYTPISRKSAITTVNAGAIKWDMNQIRAIAHELAANGHIWQMRHFLRVFGTWGILGPECKQIAISANRKRMADKLEQYSKIPTRLVKYEMYIHIE